MKTLPVLALALALIAPFAFAVIDSGSADSKAAAASGDDTSACHSGGICAAPPAIPATPAPAAAAAKSGATPYPLTTCVISGKKLGAMGEPVIYTYKQKNQPDQTVKFCCKGCIGPFNKNPAPALAKIAAARKADAATSR
jgi:hypothetical protein